MILNALRSSYGWLLRSDEVFLCPVTLLQIIWKSEKWCPMSSSERFMVCDLRSLSLPLWRVITLWETGQVCG